MTRPVYKIETWTGDDKDYTIEADVVSLFFKEVLTYGVGTFSFTVPTVKGIPDPYYFSDIAIDDIIKIWLRYNSVSGDPDFIGKVTKLNGRLSTAEGYVRQISGLSQGEVLLRKFKRDRLWSGVAASDIVEEICDDLGLGKTKVEADATSETIEVQTERYIDALKRVSDYYDAGGSVKKDFFVNVDNDLVWASRDGTPPFRTTPDVEALTIGKNVIRCNVIRDVNPVKNNITVYGARFEVPASTHDGYTEATTNWTSNGTVTAHDADYKAGQYSIQATKTVGSAPWTLYLQRTFDSIRCGWQHQRYARFYWKYFHNSPVVEYDVEIALLAPDWSNRFTKDVGLWKSEDVWYHRNMELGPHGGWASTGDPDWLDVQGWRISHLNGHGMSSTLRVDELYFTGGHYYGVASSGAADRDFEGSDARLTSDTLCTERAQTLLYQKSGQPIQIQLAIIGNPNVLVGDRIPLIIPSEGISEQDFDVIAVVQSFNTQGFITTPTMLNSENIRQPLQTNILEALINTQQAIKALSRDQKIIS